MKSGATRRRNGNGEGAFKSSWGKAIYQDGETSTEHDSPSKLATALGLRVTGHSDMVHVFTKPISAVTGTEIPDLKLSVDAERGVKFIVTKQ